jgi:hypothetical protein
MTRFRTLPSPKRFAIEVHRRMQHANGYATALRANQDEYDQLAKTKPFDSSSPYVLFPLQYHPEITTYPLAGKHADSFDAVLRIRSLLPPEIQIAVSEHPMQYRRPRVSGFYSHLSLVDSVRFVPSSSPSSEYLQGALSVVNHGGTIGWEALARGKSVVSLSGCFYREAPGVTMIDDATDENLVISRTRNSNELQDWANSFARSLFHGIIDENYFIEIAEDDRSTIEQDTRNVLWSITEKWIHNLVND